MKPASLGIIKKELNRKSGDELEELVLRLTKFKVENKELLTYLLFDIDDEAGFIENIKRNLDSLFEEINTANFYYIKKGIRRILRTLKRYIRYSQNKETEVELLLYFCEKLINFKPSIKSNKAMMYLFEKQKELIAKRILLLHEDLQYDYNLELDTLTF